ncbi:MAG: hypothetical protein FWD03_02190 [Defluviitaleaceae bacterium]|nr:hypothetical protein [Defluviitaleaceae bacterium]
MKENIYAYVTFLMRGDGYLPGALVLAYALKMQTKYDCICLITEDVSHKVRYALNLIYDKVILVNELRIKSSVSTGRSDRNVLLTKFEALQLGTGGNLGQQYDKIILLDADILPLGGYDDLFLLPTPAGIVMEKKKECYSGAIAMSNKWSWHSQYENICRHGERIPKEITDRVGYDLSNMGINAGLWVLTPSQLEYRNIVTMLDTPEISALTKQFPWPEMQLATLLWSGNWTNIDIRYCSIGGYPRLDVLYGIHFAGLKPWQIKNRSAKHYAKYPDFILWQQFYMTLYWSLPDLHGYPALKRLCEFFLSTR